MTPQQLQQLQTRTKLLGDLGEDFVLRYELQRLRQHPQASAIDLIGRHDVGLGYDILSFEGITSQHLDRYIEVKTYSGQPHFYLSEGEQAAAHKYGDSYYLYLVDESRIQELGYEPLIICNPLVHLPGIGASLPSVIPGCDAPASVPPGPQTADRGGTTPTAPAGHWELVSQRCEFRYVAPQQLPDGFECSTVLVGCFNSNEHLQWILHNHAYNVRQGIINGSVRTDEVSQDAQYLILYNGCSPRSYRMYGISGVSTATNAQLRQLGYPYPHASQYLLYHLAAKLPEPPIDIMQLLRTHNDKLQRTSGTPIYLSGQHLRQYLLSIPLQSFHQNVRYYTNEGKPWTQVQTLKLTALYQSGPPIAQLAHEFRRTADEVKAQLIVLGLLSGGGDS